MVDIGIEVTGTARATAWPQLVHCDVMLAWLFEAWKLTGRTFPDAVTKRVAGTVEPAVEPWTWPDIGTTLSPSTVVWAPALNGPRNKFWKFWKSDCRVTDALTAA